MVIVKNRNPISCLQLEIILIGKNTNNKYYRYSHILYKNRKYILYRFIGFKTNAIERYLMFQIVTVILKSK